MKLTIILATVCFLLLGGTYLLYQKIESLNKEISIQAINLKSERYKTTFWVDEFGKSHSKYITQIRSIAELKRGNDSVALNYRNLLKKYDIALKTIDFLGTITTEIKHDTVVKVKVLFGCHDLSNKWIQNIVCINRDTSISSNILTTDQFDIISNSKKETIDPPYSFFLFRWFQKKQWINSVEIINNNPYSKTKSQNFIIINK